MEREGQGWREGEGLRGRLIYHKVVFLPSLLATYDDSILLFQ